MKSRLSAELGLRDCARAIAAGRLTSLDVVNACLERYRVTEPRIRAFAWLDEDRARRLARQRDTQPRRGPLHGIPIAVKDIFDTAGIPTECGSRLFRGRVPSRSASVVRALDSAGAVVLGKTVTAELAYAAPGPTRNPHDVSRTPGGSSQGSAAAVAAGVVPGAVGSQTNGSTIRPAAFCGVVGFKPTARRIPMRGALQFSRTLDQVGVFARSVEDAALLAATLAREPIGEWLPERDFVPRLAAVRTTDWGAAQGYAHEHFLSTVDAISRAGGQVEWPKLPVGLERAADILGLIMAYEAARSIGRVAELRPDLVSVEAESLFIRGRTIGSRDYKTALAVRASLIQQFRRWAAPYDAILTLPAPGEAPGAETTGDPRFCSRWSLVGAPAISIPTGVGPSGLPLGLQLVTARGTDRRLLSAAGWVAGWLGSPVV